LSKMGREFAKYWPLRNKGTPAKCATFLKWRSEDYLRGGVFGAGIGEGVALKGDCE
jgi:hypothetical protein